MSVKRFVAANMSRALELVREEMGPDAIILSSRRIKQGVEILTSMEPQPLRATPPPAVDSPISGVDVPMGSDGAWHDQATVDNIVNSNPSLLRSPSASLASSVLSSTDTVSSTATTPQHAFSTKMASSNNVSSRGLASGKTPAQLADEMEQARLRMLAARKEPSLEDMTIGDLASSDFALADTASVARGVESRRGPQQGASSSLSAAPQEPYEQRQERLQQESFQQQELLQQQQQELLQQQQQELLQQQQQSRQQAQQQEQLHALRSELADMRLLLEEQLTRAARTPQLSTPLHSSIMRRLRHMGIGESLAEAVIAEVKETHNIQDAWTEALACLARRIPTSAGDRVMQGGVFAFVGPTGVGKTTTVAKLAARYVLERGAENITLVTTDTYRIAAHDQLRSLGRILNVQVKVVDDNQDLPAVLRSLKGCPLVLVDTAGFRQGDSQLKEQLKALSQVPQLQTVLVMACNSQLQMMKASIHAHQGANLAGCILTKLDETASLGEAVSAILEHNLALLYTTDGQEIPQDLAVARGHQLVTRAVALMKAGPLVAGGMVSPPRSVPGGAEQLY